MRRLSHFCSEPLRLRTPDAYDTGPKDRTPASPRAQRPSNRPLGRDRKGMQSVIFDIQRLVEFDFLRATEMAALHSMQWVGKGNKEAADAAASDAIRGMFDLTDMRGTVVIGEGIKDKSPGI